MFRRIKPIEHREEVNFPADLKKLGYYINDKDQLRQISAPEKGFQYHVHKVDRVNERRREAIDECIRRILDTRFTEHGLKKVFFPPGSTPQSDPCVPILISEDLDQAEKVLIIVGNTYDNLGVWSVREMEGPGINHGSMISTVTSAKKEKFSCVILNPGQNVYSPELKKAVTHRTWHALTKSSPHLDEKLNRVPGHENVRNHVKNVLEEIKDRVLGKKVYFLTYGWGCWGVIKYFNEHFDEWKKSVQALIAVESTHTPTDILHPDLHPFLLHRSRAYIVHSDPAGTFIPDKRFVSQTFSTSQMFSETIIPCTWNSIMLPWFKRVEEDPEGCNPVMLVDWESVEKLREGWGGYEVKKDEGDPDKWAFEEEDEDEEKREERFGDEGLGEVLDLRDERQERMVREALGTEIGVV